MQLRKTFASGGRNFKETWFNVMTNTVSKSVLKSRNSFLHMQLQMNKLHNQFIHAISSHSIVRSSS